MWTLECDGPLFEGKKLWLKPGSRFLIGRTPGTASGTKMFSINNKSVSKQHIQLEVGTVKAGNGSNLHTRSELRITDLNSKIGTIIDGEKIAKNEPQTLKGNEHVVKLGRADPLRIKWQPVVLTFGSLSKTEKKSADPLASYRQSLEPLDIKLVNEYVFGQTTHVVAEKRNLPSVLRALVHGKYIVGDKFISALVSVAESADETVSAPLEVDFEASWPDAMQFVPPPSKEPNPRPADHFAPKAERAAVFAGYTFVFCQQSQYDNLSSAINGGGGKALLYEHFQEGKTDPNDVVAYVKNVAGEKGLGEFEDGSEGKGVVVVRVTTKNKTWTESFMHEVDEQLNQRSLEQNEFLDCIIMNDATTLRQQLVEEVDLTNTADYSSQTIMPNQSLPIAPTAPNPVPPSSPVPQPPKVEAPPTVSRRGRRPVTQSRFKGFDDFDPSQIPKTEIIHESDDDESMQEVQSQASPNQQRAPNPRKRTPPPEDDEDVIEELLPAAAAMKKRKLNNGNTLRQTQSKDRTPVVDKKPLRKSKEIDVIEIARARREAEDEAARLDAELLKEQMEGMDIDAIRNNIHVVEMKLKPREKSNQTSREVEDHDNWHGRKNFKGFRRKGQPQAIRGHGVIVPLQVVKKKDYGMGQEHWLEPASKQKKTSQARSVESQTLRPDEEEDDIQFRHRPGRKQRSQVIVDEDDDVVEVPNSVPDSTNSTTRVSQTQTQTQTQKAKKRLGGELPKTMQPPPPKKGRPAPRRDEDSDSEDDLKFRFRRKR